MKYSRIYNAHECTAIVLLIKSFLWRRFRCHCRPGLLEFPINHAGTEQFFCTRRQRTCEIIPTCELRMKEKQPVHYSRHVNAMVEIWNPRELDQLWISRVFFNCHVDIFSWTILSKGGTHNEINPMWSTNPRDKDRPQHREPYALLFSISVWVL